MKVLVLTFLAACVFAVQAFNEADLDVTDLFCLEKLGYDKSVVIDSFDENELIKEGNAQMNTFFECAWKEDGFTYTDGSVNIIGLASYALKKVQELYPNQDSNNLVTAGISACKDVKGSSNGDTYVKMYNCLYSKVAELVAA